MIKKQIWLTSLVTMTMVLQLMAPVLAAQTAVGNEPNGADFKAQLPAVINSSSDGSIGDDFKNNWLAKYQTAYQQGLQDAMADKPQLPPDQEPIKTAYCQGFKDGSQLALEHADWLKCVQESQQNVVPVLNDQTAADHGADNNESASNEQEADQDNAQLSSDQATSEVPSANQHYAPLCPTRDQARFIAHLGPIAQKVGQKHDLYASVLIAQAALESNWGTSELSRVHHNLFGIKGTWHGHGVSMMTQECLSGKPAIVAGTFKSYTDEKASLSDYAAVLDQPMYAGAHRSNAPTYRSATSFLKGRYATDPKYDQKLNQLIEAYQLTRFDRPVNQAANSSLSRPRTDQRHQQHQTAALVESRRPTQKKQPQKAVRQHTWLPVASGIGSVGILEVLRRMYLK